LPNTVESKFHCCSERKKKKEEKKMRVRKRKKEKAKERVFCFFEDVV
jgi:hypothetical protein